MISFAQVRKASRASWHQVRLDASQLAAREHERMVLRFSRSWMHSGWPRGMRLWMAADGDGGAELYLSPAATRPASELIRRYAAQACEPPDAAMILIAGDGYVARAPSPRAAAASPQRLAVHSP